MNPLVPTGLDFLIAALAAGYLAVLIAAVIMLLRDTHVSASQRLRWLVVFLVLPVLGVITYVVVRRRARAHSAPPVAGGHLE